MYPLDEGVGSLLPALSLRYFFTQLLRCSTYEKLAHIMLFVWFRSRSGLNMHAYVDSPDWVSIVAREVEHLEEIRV